MSTKIVQLDHSRYDVASRELVDRALEWATSAHKGQKRRSGKPYITHPVAVAETVAEWGLDAEAVAAALLHDTVEDTASTMPAIEADFGRPIASLVDGLTKLKQIEMIPQADSTSAHLVHTNENLRKLLLASTEDMRVLLIKLADRRHNLQTLGYLDPAQCLRIARESLEIYAPLADRLGMGQLKSEIEDLSFRHSLPDAYAVLQKQVRATTRGSDRYIMRLRRELTILLDAAGVKAESIEGRQKHLYSIYKKLPKVDGDVTKLYDLIAVRITVADVATCYQVLGLLHQAYKPLISRIKDYIAVPKPNGYRSLHTTVFALDGRITEIQIRTPEMHAQAELGLAAHFHYDAQKSATTYKQRGGVTTLPANLGWVSALKDLRSEAVNGQDFVEGARLELFTDRIFVFSPKGDLYDLPEGATALDFAFAIHSQVGLRTLGAKVNSRLVTLDSRLENRDVVEIITRKQAAPNRDWLGFVRTTTARNRIKAWFRAASRSTNLASGRAALEPELRAWSYKKVEDIPKDAAATLFRTTGTKSWDDVLVLIGEGSLSVAQVLRRLFPTVVEPFTTAQSSLKTPTKTGRVLIESAHLPYVLAPCCSPVYPQPIVGYVTRGKGITVHRQDCRNLPAEMDRLAACQWELEGGSPKRLVRELEIVALNRVGLLRDITLGVAKHGSSIVGMASESGSDDQATVRFKLEVGDLHELATIIRQLKKIAGVRSVTSI
jgi:guanosine-3',5'-bis(diphosphate) 3'-pyrophosphohydrolase